MKVKANFWMSRDGSRGTDDIILFNIPNDMTEEENDNLDVMTSDEDYHGIVEWVKARNIPHAISVWNADAQEQELHIVPAK